MEGRGIIKTEFYCTFCETDVSKDEKVTFDKKALCTGCLEEHTDFCFECDERVWKETAAVVEENIYCHDCYDEYFDECCGCRAVVSKEEATYEDEGHFCAKCHEREFGGSLKAHDYYPKPTLFGEGPLYGVELEADVGGEDVDSAESVLEVANANYEHLYIKRDGTLSQGFEVVSHPMTLLYHRDVMCWPEVLNKLQELGYCSEDTSACGFHVHVDRKSLGDTVEEQEEAIANILYFIDTCWEQVVKFGRRTVEEVSRWAARYTGIDSREKALEYAKGVDSQRHICVNLQNSGTVELRIFKGTLDYFTFIATLQFVDEVCTKIAKMAVDALNAYTWDEFVLDIDATQKPKLMQYIIVNDLFFSTPQTESEVVS